MELTADNGPFWKGNKIKVTVRRKKIPSRHHKGHILEVFFFSVWNFLQKQKWFKEGPISLEFIKSLGTRSSVIETSVKYIPSDIEPLKTQETI